MKIWRNIFVGFFILAGLGNLPRDPIAGIIALFIASTPFIYSRIKSDRARSAAQREHEKREKEQIAIELAEKRDRAMRDRDFEAQQQAISNSTASQKLRHYVTEIRRYVALIRKDPDNSNIFEAIHQIIDHVASDNDIRPLHFKNDILKFDINLILQTVEEITPSDNTLLPRLRKVLREYEPMSNPNLQPELKPIQGAQDEEMGGGTVIPLQPLSGRPSRFSKRHL